MGQKIGIMGGTFDPIHIGHLILGEAAQQQFGLDKVLYMPAGNPPHKRHREGRATDEQRTEMVRLAIEDNPHFELSMMEMNADGYSYTYRTLERFKAEHPENEYYFIIGADSLYDFDQWKEPQRICDAGHIICATRNQTPSEEFQALLEKRRKQYNGDFLLLDSPNLDISSNNLRRMIAEGKSVRYYIRYAVIEYIRENSIYSSKEME
ncbi:MAG: nicotinate-nucleotide adenylyltransferase [Lachnospiraceae bacterium]|nr:nicotinate-nucleotide adenylyltransferase [Lachnospiraceae bacterium]